MARAFLLVMDSFGIGHAPDAAAFGDEGANTYKHIREGCSAGKADIPGVRSGTLKLPFLESLGLKHAAMLARGRRPASTRGVIGQWGCMASASTGKDTISGHWEMCGLPVRFEWGYFHDHENSFPPDFIEEFCRRGEIGGILGNCHASGTLIIEQLGEEHIRTGRPICYTSADSVFQIAAHEEHFGLQRLYKLCELAREMLDEYNIGRIIARPFSGDRAKNFRRTGNRRDYAIPPTGPTLLDRITGHGGQVHAIGKIRDIFAARGISRYYPGQGLDGLMAATIEARDNANDGDLVFTNFVDFDMLYGHTRDLPGYAVALEHFDTLLREFAAGMTSGDLLVITADHGNDPSWHGYDHTREQVPALFLGMGRGCWGSQPDFTPLAETIATHLRLA